MKCFSEKAYYLATSLFRNSMIAFLLENDLVLDVFIFLENGNSTGLWDCWMSLLADRIPNLVPNLIIASLLPNAYWFPHNAMRCCEVFHVCFIIILCYQYSSIPLCCLYGVSFCCFCALIK